MTNVSQTHSSALITRRSSGTGRPDLLCPDWHERLQRGLCLARSLVANQQVSGDFTDFTLNIDLQQSIKKKCQFNDAAKPTKYVKRK